MPRERESANISNLNYSEQAHSRGQSTSWSSSFFADSIFTSIRSDFWKKKYSVLRAQCGSARRYVHARARSASARMNGTDATTQSGIGRLGKRIVSSFSWRRKAYVAAPSSAGVAYLRRSACAPVG